MIDLNDGQIKNGQLEKLLTNITFKNEIEKGDQKYGCPGLKNAKYIYLLKFSLNMTKLYDKTKSVEK